MKYRKLVVMGLLFIFSSQFSYSEAIMISQFVSSVHSDLYRFQNPELTKNIANDMYKVNYNDKILKKIEKSAKRGNSMDQLKLAIYYDLESTNRDYFSIVNLDESKQKQTDESLKQLCENQFTDKDIKTWKKAFNQKHDSSVKIKLKVVYAIKALQLYDLILNSNNSNEIETAVKPLRQEIINRLPCTNYSNLPVKNNI